MSDPIAEEGNLTGMVPNGAFADEGADWGPGQGGDAETDGIEIEGEPDPGPERIEPGQG